MKNAQTILENYVTPDGSVFKYEEGEEIIVDSFSYISTMRRLTYIGFLTNYRFIFKQSEVFSATGGMGIEESLSADCSFIWLKDLKGVKIKKNGIVFDGTVIDFSKNQDTENWDYGTYGKGTFGGLSYTRNDELYGHLINSLADLSKKYAFHIWAPGRPDMTTSTQEQKRRLNHIRSRKIKIILGSIGILVGGLCIYSYATGVFNSNPDPVSDTDTETETKILDSTRLETDVKRPGAPPLVTSESTPTKIALAEHLTAMGAVMYSAYWCSQCHEQKEVFGLEAAKKLTIVECAEDGQNSQRDICQSKKIEGFPTWEINGKLDSGVKDLNTLAGLSGFEGSTNSASTVKTPARVNSSYPQASLNPVISKPNCGFINQDSRYNFGTCKVVRRVNANRHIVYDIYPHVDSLNKFAVVLWDDNTSEFFYEGKKYESTTTKFDNQFTRLDDKFIEITANKSNYKFTFIPESRE